MIGDQFEDQYAQFIQPEEFEVIPAAVPTSLIGGIRSFTLQHTRRLSDDEIELAQTGAGYPPEWHSGPWCINVDVRTDGTYLHTWCCREESLVADA